MDERGPLVWRHGEPSVRDLVERWWRGEEPPSPYVLLANPHRRVVRLAPRPGEALVVKHFVQPHGMRRLREAVKARIGRAPAEREWRALAALRQARIPVPEPLGRAAVRGGGELLITAYVPGESLLRALASADPTTEAELAEAVGERVRALHDAGFAHRDLHVGNFVIAPNGPILLDLQRVERMRSPAARATDVGAMDFSLAWAGASDETRARFRTAAGAGAGADALEASRKHGERHYRARARQCLRASEALPAIRLAGLRGLRVSELETSAVAGAIAAHDALAAGPPITHAVDQPVPDRTPAILKRDHRSLVTAVEADGRPVVVKEVRKGGWRRRLADAFRGSPARRGWIAGHGLIARGIGVAAPLAYLETRRFGVPVRSLLVCDDLRTATPVSLLAADGDARTRLAADRVLAALTDLVIRLHRTGVTQGDLQAQHIYLESEGERLRTRLIDLEGVQLDRRLTDAERLEELAVLNASLADDLAPTPARRRALRRYLAAMRFEWSEEEVASRIARRSRERGGAWRGRDCSVSSARP